MRKASGRHGAAIGTGPDIKAERDERTLIHPARARLISEHFLQLLTKADSARE